MLAKLLIQIKRILLVAVFASIIGYPVYHSIAQEMERPDPADEAPCAPAMPVKCSGSDSNFNCGGWNMTNSGECNSEAELSTRMPSEKISRCNGRAGPEASRAMEAFRAAAKRNTENRTVSCQDPIRVCYVWGGKSGSFDPAFRCPQGNPVCCGDGGDCGEYGCDCSGCVSTAYRIAGGPADIFGTTFTQRAAYQNRIGAVGRVTCDPSFSQLRLSRPSDCWVPGDALYFGDRMYAPHVVMYAGYNTQLGCHTIVESTTTNVASGWGFPTANPWAGGQRTTMEGAMERCVPEGYVIAFDVGLRFVPALPSDTPCEFEINGQQVYAMFGGVITSASGGKIEMDVKINGQYCRQVYDGVDDKVSLPDGTVIRPGMAIGGVAQPPGGEAKFKITLDCPNQTTCDVKKNAIEVARSGVSTICPAPKFDRSAMQPPPIPSKQPDDDYEKNCGKGQDVRGVKPMVRLACKKTSGKIHSSTSLGGDIVRYSKVYVDTSKLDQGVYGANAEREEVEFLTPEAVSRSLRFHAQYHVNPKRGKTKADGSHYQLLRGTSNSYIDFQTHIDCSDKIPYGLPPSDSRKAFNWCVDQYILGRAEQNAEKVFEPAGQLPNISEKDCQPLAMVPDKLPQEYKVRDFLEHAWNKRFRNGILGMTPPPGASFGISNVNDYTAKEYERINDPSNPFSPRQHTVGIERIVYASAASGAGGPVICAPEEVEIMSFRAEKFNTCIMCRINFNKEGYCVERDDETGECEREVQPCSLQYTEDDNPEADGACEARCGPLGNTIQRQGDCCFQITRPVTPINVLKYRSSQETFVNNEPVLEPMGPQDLENSDAANNPVKGNGELPQKTTEYRSGGHPSFYFAVNFQGRRPFMRWWDTGAEAGQKSQNEIDVTIDKGSKDVVVGVGVPGSNCSQGGWNELKAYQARSIRDFHLSCLAKYERTFKWGAAEEFVLRRAGGEYTKRITYMRNDKKYSRSVAMEYPLGWRGYISEPNPELRFPNWPPGQGGKDMGIIYGGLDNAQAGDIIVWDEDVTEGQMQPHAAYVVAVSNKAGYQGKEPPEVYIKVMDYNFGKFPDICGNTNWWAQGTIRTLYRDKLPSHFEDEREDLNLTKPYDVVCRDPDLSSCVEEFWKKVKIYRPAWDYRRCNTSTPTP